MLKTIRADFYRLFHSKGFFITQGILIVLIMFIILTETVGSIASGSGVVDSQSQLISVWTGTGTVTTISTMASSLLYFCLPLFIMTLGFDLSRKTYKNLLTAGVSRLSFLLSKYIVFLIMSALQFVFYYGVAFLSASIKNGVGELDVEFFQTFGQAVGFQFFSLQAIFVLGLIATVCTFSNVAGVLTVVIVPLVLMLLPVFIKSQDWLTYLCFQQLIDAAWMTSLPDHFWLKAAVSISITIVLGLTLSYQQFRKKEL